MSRQNFKVLLGMLVCLGLPPVLEAGQPVELSRDKEVFSFKKPESYAPQNPMPAPPPMFGDQFQGFNLQGGFNFQGGGQFQGGFNGGGFNFQGGGQFQGGFNQGGLNFQGGGQFQGGSNFQRGGGFNRGGGQIGGQFGGQIGGFNFQLGGIAIAPFRGAYKIGENESPRPENRIYVNYNYYDNAERIADVHRETVGVEKTLFTDQLSLGMRLPFLQVESSVADDEHDVGDLSVILKYAPYLNRQTGNTFTIGLAFTSPTGTRPTTFRLMDDFSIREIHPWLWQPFVGYIWNYGKFYIQGFTSVQVPSDSGDVTMLYNDFGLGYRIPLGGHPFHSIVPTLEVHVNTPLNHRESSDFPRFRDAVDLTGGFHLYFTERVSLGAAVGTTVTGQRLYDVEALVNLNFGF